MEVTGRVRETWRVQTLEVLDGDGEDEVGGGIVVVVEMMMVVCWL